MLLESDDGPCVCYFGHSINMQLLVIQLKKYACTISVAHVLYVK